MTITAKVSDEKGSASAETTVLVKQRTAITARRLPDIVFPKNSARVNNCGKRVLLEELKSLFESDPTGTVVFVGHTSENESASSGLDQKRALNAAAVISAGQGICANFPAAQTHVNAAGSAAGGANSSRTSARLQPAYRNGLAKRSRPVTIRASSGVWKCGLSHRGSATRIGRGRKGCCLPWRKQPRLSEVVVRSSGLKQRTTRVRYAASQDRTSTRLVKMRPFLLFWVAIFSGSLWAGWTAIGPFGGSAAFIQVDARHPGERDRRHRKCPAIPFRR